jgi:hypothetical protein
VRNNRPSCAQRTYPRIMKVLKSHSSSLRLTWRNSLYGESTFCRLLIWTTRSRREVDSPSDQKLSQNLHQSVGLNTTVSHEGGT